MLCTPNVREMPPCRKSTARRAQSCSLRIACTNGHNDVVRPPLCKRGAALPRSCIGSRQCLSRGSSICCTHPVRERRSAASTTQDSAGASAYFAIHLARKRDRHSSFLSVGRGVLQETLILASISSCPCDSITARVAGSLARVWCRISYGHASEATFSHWSLARSWAEAQQTMLCTRDTPPYEHGSIRRLRLSATDDPMLSFVNMASAADSGR